MEALNSINEQIRTILTNNSTALFGFQIESSLIQFQKTRKEVEGDVTLVIFPFVKVLKCSPVEAGEKIGSFLLEHLDAIGSYAVVSGFLNMVITPAYWVSQLGLIDQLGAYGMEEPNSKPTIMVEYSSPNTNKPLHLGHLRNNFLGFSVAEILKANGYNVVKTQIINDRGIHICKSMLAWEKFSPLNEKGEKETPENTGLKGDKLVGKYYVEFDKQFNAEAKSIIELWEKGDTADFSNQVIQEFERLTQSKVDKDEKAIKGIDEKIKDLAKNETTLLREAKDMLVKWEARDPQVYLLWTTMNGWVYKGFEVTYQNMGVSFDKLYYESDTFTLGKDIVFEGLEKGVFYKKEDGSVWIDLTADGLDEKLLLRSDGTTVYMTQDIGTAVDRYKDFSDLNGIIYTVGNEQDYHFKVLFLILQKLGYAWADNCFHLSYGMVDLPSGKMKSREGTVVDADDLMQDVIDKATELTKERGHLEGMSAAEINQLCRTIGMGGLKYYLLKVDPKKRMMFNPDESIELNGNTGPFIQYAYARINSLLNRSVDIKPLIESPLKTEEIEIIKVLLEYPQIIEAAAREYSPAVIANYSYELVKLFNQFYQAIPIFNEENEDIQSMRLIMCRNVAKVIASSMKLLGVDVPKKM